MSPNHQQQSDRFEQRLSSVSSFQSIMSEIAAVEPGAQCEVKHLKRSYVGDLVVTEDGLDFEKASIDAALVSTQNFDKDDKPAGITLTISSKHILAALSRVAQKYPAHDEKFDKLIELKYPFEFLYHHCKELADEATKLTGDGSFHLKLLLAYLEKQTGDEADRLTTSQIPSITFDLLWFLFKSGALLYTLVEEESLLHWLLRASYDEMPVNGSQWEYFKLHCLYHGYYGKERGTVSKTLKIFEIKEFSGNLPEIVTRLSGYPLKFYKNEDGIKARLTKRCKRYLELVNMQGTVYHYDDLCRRLRTPPGSSYFTREENFSGVWLLQTASGRIILDGYNFMESIPAHCVKIFN